MENFMFTGCHLVVHTVVVVVLGGGGVVVVVELCKVTMMVYIGSETLCLIDALLKHCFVIPHTL